MTAEGGGRRPTRRESLRQFYASIDWGIGGLPGFSGSDAASSSGEADAAGEKAKKEVPPPPPMSASAGPKTKDRYAPSSRYDPNSVARIFDINDLVDESYGSSEDSEEGGGAEASAGGGASSRPPRKKKTNVGRIWVRGLAVVATACFAGGASLGVRHLVQARHLEEAGREQQRLLEIAEQVVTACDLLDDDPDEDDSECQGLCLHVMCCVEPGSGSCREERGDECLPYTGCEALLPEYDRKGA